MVKAIILFSILLCSCGRESDYEVYLQCSALSLKIAEDVNGNLVCGEK